MTDLGRALISGNCADVGKVKGPLLRGLAARAPYFATAPRQRLFPLSLMLVRGLPAKPVAHGTGGRSEGDPLLVAGGFFLGLRTEPLTALVDISNSVKVVIAMFHSRGIF